MHHNNNNDKKKKQKTKKFVAEKCKIELNFKKNEFK